MVEEDNTQQQNVEVKKRGRKPSVQKKTDVETLAAATDVKVSKSPAPLPKARKPSATKKVAELAEKTNTEAASADATEVVEAKKRVRKPKAATEEPNEMDVEDKENSMKGKKQLVKTARTKVFIEHW